MHKVSCPTSQTVLVAPFVSHLGMFTGADNMKTTLTTLLSGIVLLEKGQWENPGLFLVVAKEEGSRAGIHRDRRTGGYEQRFD